ncbi:ArsR family transcriptional regulator [Algivirga pacifica]|uniref:ArsR family transcriptional regulator n=1 Tax=Algivirga pacifica TaxID=1162670 RepID=UPI0031E7F7EE
MAKLYLILTIFEMLEALITSKTRLKLLLKFFLNPSNTSYLRGLATEFSESTNAVRVELNRLEEANMLLSTYEGNKKIFRVNTTHPLFPDIQAIVFKYVGLDKLIEKVLDNIGDLKEVYLVGALANGVYTEGIDLVIVGDVNEVYLCKAVQKVEETIKKPITYTLDSSGTFSINHLPESALKIWESYGE